MAKPFSAIDSMRNETWGTVHGALQVQAKIDFGVLQDFWLDMNDNAYKQVSWMVLSEFYE